MCFRNLCLQMFVIAGLGSIVISGSAVGNGNPGNLAPFTEEALDRGLNYTILPYPAIYGYSGFGCGFADLNNSGALDVIVMGASDRSVGVFENDGNGFFTVRSTDNGIPTLPEGSAFAVGDYNGNGFLDIYFTQIGEPNVLMANNGDFTFTDKTQFANVGDPGAGTSAAFGDFTNDGWLDLYVCNYNGIVPGTGQFFNVLYKNRGDGSYSNVSTQLDMSHNGLSFQAGWIDINRNGWLDLYVSNDRGYLTGLQENQLWRNDGGTFTNISKESGADVALFAMSVGVGDFDGNGFPDLYITDLAGYEYGYNPLLLNQGDETFIEAQEEAGVDHWKTSWSSIFFDFTNNGWLDLYVNNQFLPNTLYMHPGTFPATDVAEEVGVIGAVGASDGHVSYASAVGDVTGNGAMDLILNDLGTNVQLYINHEGLKRNWVRWELIGIFPNTHSVGANVDTRTGAFWQYRENYSGSNGYLSQNELVIHVGVDDATIIDEAVVNWPSMSGTRTLTNYPVNQKWLVYHPDRLGDANHDGTVNFDDFLVLADCFDQQIQPGCEAMDFTGNGMIESDDAIAFFDRYEGEVTDCIDSGQPDLFDILLNPSLDQNGNWVIDACENGGIPGDLTGDGTVGVDDLLIVLNNWGSCRNCNDCFGDITGDCTVGVDDLLIVLNNWGACEDCEELVGEILEIADKCEVDIDEMMILYVNWQQGDECDDCVAEITSDCNIAENELRTILDNGR